MKKVFFLLIFLCLGATSAMAVPFLQLDISNNVQDNPGGFAGAVGGTDLLYAAFNVDVSGLANPYAIHKDKLTAAAVAPFSHDAESSTPVPEPATLFLLGTGLIGTGLITRRKLRK